jgi:hypothetical protein
LTTPTTSSPQAHTAARSYDSNNLLTAYGGSNNLLTTHGARRTDLTTPTTSSPQAHTAARSYDSNNLLTAYGGSINRLTTARARRTDLTTPTTSSPQARTAARSYDSNNLLTTASARHTSNTAELVVAPASKSMDYNRELGRQHSLQDLVQRLLRRLENTVYNDLTSLTRGVDLHLRSRRFGLDLSTS